jgi:DNA-directed RNA polymerase specialized sigma24 family protein
MVRTMTDAEFTEFAHAAWPGLHRTAYLLVGDHQLAEDLTQTALAKTYGSWHRVKDPAAARSYARVVLVNTAASWFRRRSWRNEQPTEHLPDAVVDLDPSTRTAVLGALAGLAPRQRAVVTPSGSRAEVCDPGTGGCERTGQTGSGQLTLVLGTPGSQL